jgi:hypothetical protein
MGFLPNLQTADSYLQFPNSFSSALNLPEMPLSSRHSSQEISISQLASSAYSRQAELRIMLQKFARLNCGSRSARTSSFTVPKVVSGLLQKPSWKA